MGEAGISESEVKTMTLQEIEAALTYGAEQIEKARQAGDMLAVEVLTEVWMILFEKRAALKAA